MDELEVNFQDMMLAILVYVGSNQYSYLPPDPDYIFSEVANDAVTQFNGCADQSPLKFDQTALDGYCNQLTAAVGSSNYSEKDLIVPLNQIISLLNTADKIIFTFTSASSWLTANKEDSQFQGRPPKLSENLAGSKESVNSKHKKKHAA